MLSSAYFLFSSKSIGSTLVSKLSPKCAHPTVPSNLAEQPTKALRSELASRGLSCDHCDSHADLVEFVKRHWDAPRIAQWSNTQLRAAISDRALSCDDCTEKSDLVEFLREHWDEPIVPKKKKPARAAPASGKGFNPNAVLDDVRAAYAANGRDPDRPDEPADLSAAEQVMQKMQAQMDGNNGFFDASTLDLSGIKQDKKKKNKASAKTEL
jgi:hypothetical protein